MNEYAALGKKSTRSGSGIGEGNYLCSGCYQKCRRNKFLKDNEEKCTSTKKKPVPKISVIKDEEESLQSVKCVLCDNIYEYKIRNKFLRCTLTDSVTDNMKYAHANRLLSVDFDGCFIHNQCSKKLSRTVNAHKCCYICKKN